MPTVSIKVASKRDQVRQHVIERIAGGLPTGTQLPAEQVLAEDLGVSKSTVRKAFEELAAEGVICQEQGRGTFVHDVDHPLVHEHRGQQVYMLGYVAPYESDDRFMAEISLGVEEGLDPERFLLVSKHVHVPTMREADVLPRLAERLRGMILMSTMTPDAQEQIRLLHRRGYPLVLIDRYLPDIPVSYVTTDSVEAGTLATRHLIELGHRRIVYVWQGARLTSVEDRIKGYQLTMRRHGLEPDVCHLPNSGQQPGLDAWVDSLVNEGLPTAIFAMCDSLALHICQCLGERGLRVPEEVSVIGIDGNREGELARVPLTTIEQPKFQMGCKAARLLEDLILGRALSGAGIQLQPRLVVRHSTAKPRA